MKTEAKQRMHECDSKEIHITEHKIHILVSIFSILGPQNKLCKIKIFHIFEK